LIENTQEPVAVEPTPAFESVEVIHTPAPTPAPMTIHEEPKAPEVEVVEEPVAVAAPVEEAKSKNDAPAPSKLAASKKVVSLSKLVFESKSRNSVSVGLVQFRLVELGFLDAGSDKYGWLSAGLFASLCGVWKDGIRRQKRNPLVFSRGLSLFQS